MKNYYELQMWRFIEKVTSHRPKFKGGYYLFEILVFFLFFFPGIMKYVFYIYYFNIIIYSDFLAYFLKLSSSFLNDYCKNVQLIIMIMT